MDKAVGEFKSTFESPGIMNVNDTEVIADMTLSFSNSKQLYTYLSNMHAMEPVISGNDLSFIAQDVPGYDHIVSWETFNKASVINKQYTLQFMANTLAPPPALKFIDKALLGATNIYRPFGSTGARVIDTHITADVAGASRFYSANFKYKLFRGTVTFSRYEVLKKGTIFDIVDKDIKIVIIESKMSLAKGVASYTGIVLAKEL